MNNKSKVLALKYRPQNFDDLIGQEVVAETITNSIKADKIPNAYLFTGIRGIGKTTTARIVAKALNCSNGIDNLCKENLCENCDSITNSSHIDVMELNGADKTSINDIREIIELSKYRPASAKYKIFIIDEVHQISTSAFNGLLKILEEPPEYIKFIFATTEIRKVPVTILSRCQRFDLSRIKSSELFDFIKKIKDKENGKVTDDALKLIVKISEGSVRDSLSLLDRALLSLDDGRKLDLNSAQKIFGYFDKSQLIDLFELILKGEETKVINIYRNIYDQGVEPKVFINDFLELLYYFKNINSLTLESTNFSLNDEEFSKIKNLSNQIDSEVLILFWQFAISSLEEIDIVSNQHLSIEMFLIRLMHLSSVKSQNIVDKVEIDLKSENLVNNKQTELTSKAINQIKNVAQEEKTKPEAQTEIKAEKKININAFEDLIETCLKKKEIKLKYELEKNVNLVKFEKNRIEISFNESLDKDFVKDLSSKLFEWTGERWIITFSKLKGQMSVKDKEKNVKKQLIDEMKNSEIFKNVMDRFPDAELIDVNSKKDGVDND
ncbi:DNA polymerase III subunit gamma/tau [Candidatus Pelagibacter sp.]|nr:DNA polymerase III subunit gamma/tau [Candidatus Pelagibacter sp.]